MPADRLMLVDGNALIHRAFHAVGPLTTSTGELVNATFGFASMLLKGIQDVQPAFAAVAFDMAEPTFRHDSFDAYKAQRPSMDPGLASQFDRVRQVVRALNIPIYETPRFEADDVLGTIATQAKHEGIRSTIVTSDVDSLQLVDDAISVLMTKQGFQDTVLFDPAEFRAKYTFDPPKLIDYKALIGDTSDNIPGVPGIGKVTATKLLVDYGNLDGIFDHLSDLKPRMADLLREHRERVFRNRDLVTITRDAPVVFSREACRISDYNREETVALFRELEFRTLLSRLPSPASETPVARPVVAGPASPSQSTLFGAIGGTPSTTEAQESATITHTVVTIPRTADELRALTEELSRCSRISIDVETTSTDAVRADLVGISLSGQPGTGAYVPVGHWEPGDGGQLTPEEALAILTPLLTRPDIEKVGHNLKYDWMVFRRYGVNVTPVSFDTMIAAYLISPAQRGLGLKDLAFSRLGVEMTPITALIGAGVRQLSMAAVAIDDAAPYAAADADMTLRLAELLAPELAEKGLEGLFHDVEMPLLCVLADMELAGITVDSEFLSSMSSEMGQQLRQLELRIYELVGHPFNINSGQQLGKVLFDELKLPSQGKTRGGSFSTGVEVLETLQGQHPIIEAILEYRQFAKLKSTYVDGVPQLINPATGRVHTSFNQTQAATGRLSSSEPNLQNIPIRTDAGRRIRAAFVAGSPGWSLLAADYSQIELRILAHITQDPQLLASFAAREDIHSATASAVFGVPLGEVTPNQRRIAKVVNFGIIYGMGEFGLARDTGLPRQEAGKFIGEYMARYPGVRRYIEQTKLEGATQGYVQTLLNRRRYLPELRSPMREVRAAAERAAINMPVQGTAADVIKLAMIRLHHDLPEQGFQARMLLQVHDELVFEAPDEELPSLATLVCDRMQHAMLLSVPLEVEVKAGKNWEVMRPIVIEEAAQAS